MDAKKNNPIPKEPESETKNIPVIQKEETIAPNNNVQNEAESDENTSKEGRIYHKKDILSNDKIFGFRPDLQHRIRGDNYKKKKYTNDLSNYMLNPMSIYD